MQFIIIANEMSSWSFLNEPSSSRDVCNFGYERREMAVFTSLQLVCMELSAMVSHVPVIFDNIRLRASVYHP